MSRGLLIFAIISLVFVAIFFGLAGGNPVGQIRNMWFPPKADRVQLATVRLGDQTFTAEVAATAADRQRGLSGRDSLPADEAMLFIFDQPGPHAFWMQGMKFSLDIIWLNGNRIVDLALNLPPPSGAPSPLYTPSEFATSVLEVNAGTVQRLGVRVGDEASVTFDGYRPR